MKLKPIALAIPMVLAAGSLSAAEIYNSGANSVELSGWAKASGNVLDGEKLTGEKLNSDLHVVTDAELSIKATHIVDEESKVIGSFVVKTGNSTDTNAEFGDIKFEYDHTTVGNISLGDTGNSFGAVEKAGAGEGGSNIYAIGQGGVDGRGIRYKKSVGDFSFSANYETDSDSNADSNYAYSGEYKTDIFSVAASYGSDGEDASSVGVGADVKIGDLTLGGTFISFEQAGSIKANDSLDIDLAGIDNEGDAYGVKAEYVINAVKLFASYQKIDGEAAGADVEATTMYAGVAYDFTDSILAYATYQTGELEHGALSSEADNFVFGAKYSF
ncbi:porin [Vibrio hannami]|uniref:porin n=1 Tax=Vibrio hannami TaxID=2717094 RepID=UPI0024107341|nr:porin [Vibrio hannami]MDG3086681.1 porin [Vibrio hannami]